MTPLESITPTIAPAIAPAIDTKRRGLLFAAGASLALPLLAGCAAPGPGAAQPSADTLDEPGFLAPPPGTRRPVALVLSGGSARGFAHLGVLRVMEQEGWRPDLVVGTSAGAIVGALYASGLSVAAIEAAAATLDWRMLFDFDPVRLLTGGIGLGIMPGEGLERFLRQHLPLSIERFPTPFAAVAADLQQGEVAVLNQGDAARAVLASCAVPGLYAPVRARRRLLSDGQAVSPLPVLVARSLGAMRVLAVDVVYPPQHAEMSSPVSVLFQAMVVSAWRLALAERALADLVLTPEIRSPAQLGLASRDWVTAAGERAARAQLQTIRALFESVSPGRSAAAGQVSAGCADIGG